MGVVGILSEPVPDAVFAALEQIASFWGFQLQVRPDGCDAGLDATIAIGTEDRLFSGRKIVTRPALFFVGPAATKARAHIGEVRFADDTLLPGTLRRQAFAAADGCRVFEQPEFPGCIVIATVGGQAVWLGREQGRGIDLVVSTPAPALETGQTLAQILNGETFLAALPAWIFFQRLAADGAGWQPAPLRACLVVDDPNLHRPSYGHISYSALVQCARQQPFHAAMAAVPLDGWWTDTAAVRLFQEQPAALSLMVHGNDHLRYELAQPMSAKRRAGLVAQSRARTQALEKKTGLRVDRVMAPPHGVCSPEMMTALWQGGYEGMTTNRWSLWKHSPPETLPTDSGLRPADMLAGGLPVVPRFRFKSSIARNEICLAALLGQPIIPYGHHGDFSEKMTVVHEIVQEINALGPVRWMSMGELLETNFERRHGAGDLFQIRIFSRRVKGELPTDCAQLQVDLPPAAVRWQPELRVDSWDARGERRHTTAKIGEPISLSPGCRFEVSLAAPVATAARGKVNSRGGYRPLALPRRLVSEARDRLKF